MWPCVKAEPRRFRFPSISAVMRKAPTSLAEVSARMSRGITTDNNANGSGKTLTNINVFANSSPASVGRCWLSVSKPELKARLVSALETKM